MDSKKCYILIQEELMNTGVIGVYTDRNVAEKLVVRLQKIADDSFAFNIMKFKLIESPINSFDFIKKAGEFLANELKDIMEGDNKNVD